MADKKVTDLTTIPALSDSDLIPIVDVSGNVTSKITRGNLMTQAPLPAGTVDEQAIEDGSVTTSKIDFSTFNQNLADTEYAVDGLFFLGNQVYQKIITFGALPNATSKSVNHGISNLQYFTYMAGISFTSGLTTISLPFVSDSTGSTNKASLVGNTVSIVVTTESNRTAFTTTYITLRYTKTA